jgi:hypothetical protein
MLMKLRLQSPAATLIIFLLEVSFVKTRREFRKPLLFNVLINESVKYTLKLLNIPPVSVYYGQKRSWKENLLHGAKTYVIYHRGN